VRRGGVARTAVALCVGVTVVSCAPGELAPRADPAAVASAGEAASAAVPVGPTDAGPCATLDAASVARTPRASGPVVELPVVDLAEVRRRAATEDASRLAPTAARVRVDTGDPRNYRIPDDNAYMRAIRLENLTTDDVGYDVEVFLRFAGGRVVEGDRLGVPPQPARNELLPRETGILWIHAGWDELGIDRSTLGEVPIEVEITLRSVDHASGQVVRFTDAVTVMPSDDPAARPHASVRGRVVDAVTGRPIGDGHVELRHGTMGVSFVPLAPDGTFGVTLPAVRSTYSGAWTPHFLTASGRGLTSCALALEVRPDDDATIEVRLQRAPVIPAWRITSTWSGVLNLNRARVASDGSLAAVVDFHSIVPADVDPTAYRAQGGLHVFSPLEGHLWSRPLGGETPAVAMDATGSLIATSIDLPGGPGGVAVFDRTGTLTWVAEHPRLAAELRRPTQERNRVVTEVGLSPDGSVLIAGTTQGLLVAWDMASRDVLWARRFPDQIREVRFLPEGILVGSGHGYLYSLTEQGEIRWRTFIGAFAIALDVSENYIVAAGKQASSVILMTHDGRILWEYETTSTTHDLDISPDEGLVVARSSAGQFRSAVLTIDGELLGTLPDGEPGAFLSDGGSMLLSGHEMTQETGDIGSIWIGASDLEGTTAWRLEDLATTIHRGPTGGLVWVSPDDRHAIVVSGEHVFTLVRDG